MIKKYSERQEESKTRQYLTEIANEEDTQYIYFECKERENITHEMKLYRDELLKKISSQLSKKRDEEFAYQTVEYEGLTTRIREKDVNILSSLALTGGTYIFEDGELELTITKTKEILKLVNAKRTEIVKIKKQIECKVDELGLYELSRFNAFCEWTTK